MYYNQRLFQSNIFAQVSINENTNLVEFCLHEYNCALEVGMLCNNHCEDVEKRLCAFDPLFELE